ncbi:hypothetical protein SUGI_0030870 [Cryptomeria japonica]|nr:hypothetical protein SUGI_0030870 [Cryptomeria japonica]
MLMLLRTLETRDHALPCSRLSSLLVISCPLSYHIGDRCMLEMARIGDYAHGMVPNIDLCLFLVGDNVHCEEKGTHVT